MNHEKIELFTGIRRLTNEIRQERLRKLATEIPNHTSKYIRREKQHFLQEA